MQGRPLYRGRGCAICRQTGYKGRTGLFEILISTPELRELISKGVGTGAMYEYAKTKQGMRTMLDEGYSKIAQGLTTPSEVFTAVYSTMSV